MGWQTDLSFKSIKKLQKLKVVQDIFSDCSGKLCIEIGAEKGIVTDYLRKHKKGRWIAGTLNDEWKDVATDLLKKDVVKVIPESIQFDDLTFDIVLVSRPEHVRKDLSLFREVHRILKNNGRFFILTPHNSKGLFLNRVKEKVGLTLEQYDHYRPGYSVSDINDNLDQAGFKMLRNGSYCRFFSEMIELTINAFYAMKSRKRAKETGESGILETSYRPTTEKDLTRNKTLFMVYEMIFPFLKMVSGMDRLIPFTNGYVLYVEAVKK